MTDCPGAAHSWPPGVGRRQLESGTPWCVAAGARAQGVGVAGLSVLLEHGAHTMGTSGRASCCHVF